MNLRKNLPLLFAGITLEMGAVLWIVLSFLQHQGLSIPAVCLLFIANLLVVAWALRNRRN